MILGQVVNCTLNACRETCTQVCAAAGEGCLEGGMGDDNLCKKVTTHHANANWTGPKLFVSGYKAAGHDSPVLCPGCGVIGKPLNPLDEFVLWGFPDNSKAENPVLELCSICPARTSTVREFSRCGSTAFSICLKLEGFQGFWVVLQGFSQDVMAFWVFVCKDLRHQLASFDIFGVQVKNTSALIRCDPPDCLVQATGLD